MKIKNAISIFRDKNDVKIKVSGRNGKSSIQLEMCIKQI